MIREIKEVSAYQVGNELFKTKKEAYQHAIDEENIRTIKEWLSTCIYDPTGHILEDEHARKTLLKNLDILKGLKFDDEV